MKLIVFILLLIAAGVVAALAVTPALLTGVQAIVLWGLVAFILSVGFYGPLTNLGA